MAGVFDACLFCVCMAAPTDDAIGALHRQVELCIGLNPGPIPSTGRVDSGTYWDYLATSCQSTACQGHRRRPPEMSTWEPARKTSDTVARDAPTFHRHSSRDYSRSFRRQQRRSRPPVRHLGKCRCNKGRPSVGCSNNPRARNVRPAPNGTLDSAWPSRKATGALRAGPFPSIRSARLY